MYENNFCPRCGYGTNGNVLFQEKYYCTKCGNKLLLKDDFLYNINKFCPRCGVVSGTYAPSDSYSQKKYCPSCGEKLKTKGQDTKRRWFF